MEKYCEQIDTIKTEIDRLESMTLIVKILDAIPIPIWFKTEKSIMKFVNRSYEQRYLTPRGYKREDYIGKDDFAVWSPDIAEAFRDNDEACLVANASIFFDEEIIEENGERVRQHFIKFPINIEGKLYVAGMRQIQARD